MAGSTKSVAMLTIDENMACPKCDSVNALWVSRGELGYDKSGVKRMPKRKRCLDCGHSWCWTQKKPNSDLGLVLNV